MQTQTVNHAQHIPRGRCVFEDYGEGRECVAVADWRASVRNTGCTASITEVRSLIESAPACLVKHGHGTDGDREEFATLVRAMGAQLPASDLEMVSV